MKSIKNIFNLSFYLIAGIIFCGEPNKGENDIKTIKSPRAKKIKKELIIHGQTRIDNYYWLNERENPDVIKYLQDENLYTAKMMAHTDKLQEKLFNEIVGRIAETDESVPVFSNGYFYYARFEPDGEHPIYCRKKGSLDAPEKVMLDVNELAEGHSYYYVKSVRVSDNNKILAFGVDDLGRRKYTVHFKDLSTGQILPDQLRTTTGDVAWANDNKTVFYTIEDQALRSYKILKHVLGANEINDQEIYHEIDETFSTEVLKSKSGEYIFIASYSTLSTEFQYLHADDPNGNFRIIQPRTTNLEYSVKHLGDKFYILTNDNAQNFKLVETSVRKATKENWQEIIPHREDVLLEKIDVFPNWLVVKERKNGLSQFRVLNLRDDSDYYIDFDEPAYRIYFGDNPEINSDVFRFDYSSLTTPSSIYDYDLNSRDRKLMKQERVIGDFDAENYITERIYAPADDGVKIPISLVYKKGLVKNGENPTILYGYGSYGYSMETNFRSYRLSLLDRGFVYAIAHIRGGQEMGRYWYENGKLLKKKNTFTDFIDCAEHLVAKNFTNPEKLFAIGGSAGGLLMGAVSNMRPELFKGIIADVAFVDVVTTMLDDSIPLTTSEYDEWGNPNDKNYYDYMLSYSPYDNVAAKDYCAMLITTGLHDSQVQYWEPAKWVAKLREFKTDDNLLLMKTDMTSGHGGAAGRYEKHKLTAFEYAFMLDLVEIK